MDEKSIGKPVEVSDETLGESIKENPLLVVDCWAPWCSPCRMIEPTINELAGDYEGRMVFAKLNVGENKKTSADYDVTSIPTLLVFKDGELVDRVTGALPREKLEPKLTKHLD